MYPPIYNSLLTLITFTSWYLTFRKMRAIMDWEKPTDARDLVEHCSKYVIPKEEFSGLEVENAGHAFVISGADHRGQRVVLKRWHGAVVPHHLRVQFTKRLTRDLDCWRALKPHPNIAPVIGVALHISNLPALVVPSYRTVTEVLAENPDTDVLPLMQGVASGLRFLHEQNPPIVHGDIKGSSIFISPAGTALLTDIGIAAIPQPPDWGFHGIDGARWLAPELMDTALRPTTAPDAVNTMRTPDVKLPMTLESDVYAFGMLSYEMHTRNLPFASTHWAATVIVRVVEGKRPARPTRVQAPQLSDELWTFITFCWKQDWRERPHMNAVEAWLSLLGRMRAVEGRCSEVVL
ncbi:kinase-like domain-containing protein [Mycena albidolilacea]|uniref:Kinase-like domain-containing protein n=1 Tax=Mycena albidolilacea TaxID=1033008 RepID=A0AAD6Z964_9AGAR|nr:kinase-like domain-containing protein [Mycena albidolilacea]